MVSIATFATLLVVTAAVTAWKYRGSKGSEGFATAWWHGVVRSPSIDATTRWAASRFAAAEAPCDVVAVRDAALRHCGADPFAVRGDAYVATGCMDPRGMAAVLDADTCMYVGYVSTDKEFVKQFIGGTSPHRGLLLFHGLGTGKTCAAIGVADSVLESDASHVDGVVVILGASIRPNFVDETTRCGSGAYRYTFVHFNGLSKAHVKAMTQGPNPFANKLVIFDEVHNLTKSVARGSSEIYDGLFRLLLTAPNAKIVALSGTPMVNDVSEIGFLVSMLRGVEETYVAKIGMQHVRSVVRNLESNPCVARFRLVPESHSVKFQLTHQHFQLRGTSLVRREAPYPADNDAVADSIVSPYLQAGQRVRKEPTTAFPLSAAEFHDKYVGEGILNVKDFQSRVLGYVSYFQDDDTSRYPRVTHETVECPMSPHQTNEYFRLREVELKMEKNMSMRGDDSSLYRSLSRRACTFAFPRAIRRLQRSDLRLLQRIQRTDGDVDALYAAHVEDVMAKLVSQPRSATWLCDELHVHSSKYAAVLQRLRALPDLGTAMIYSEFRDVPEGLRSVQAVLDFNGYSRVDIVRVKGGFRVEAEPSAKGHYMLFDPSRTSPTMQEMLHVFNGQWDALDQEIVRAVKDHFPTSVAKRKNLDGRICKIILLSASAAEGISLRNVRQVHIMEPYWQQVRIQQVIGRARRAGSHADLPPADRNVSVHLYVGTLHASQADVAPRNVRTRDWDGRLLTSDEHVLGVAADKARIIDAFATAVKEAAVDCPLWQPESTCFPRAD